jgi:intracellular sulfur oxidation DsrE/DsrF family protein
MQDLNSTRTHRRKFLGQIATGAAALGLTNIAAPFTASAEVLIETPTDPDDPEEWFKKIKGKHKIAFDVTGPNEIMPFAWPRVFLMTNELTGTPMKDNSVVVVFRHDAIPYALEDKLWTKYNFGEVFKIHEPGTKNPAKRNFFWKPKPGDFKVPGIGNVAIGINELQESGVMFFVCNVALTVYSAVVADKMGLNAEDVKKEWVAGVLPDIHIAPSGVWAIGRAQERGCGYVFAS